MWFSWRGLLLAPLLAPVLFSVALTGLLGTSRWDLGFLILLVPSCVISYGVTIILFLPCLFVLSRVRPMMGLTVCLLGLVLGASMILPMTVLDWKASGPGSGPPTEPLFAFFFRWNTDPFTLVYPLAGLMTAGAYWTLRPRRAGRMPG